MSETWRLLTFVLFCWFSNYVQNDVKKLRIGSVVFELQSAPYCQFWRKQANYRHIFIENNRLVTNCERYNQVYYTINKGLGNILSNICVEKNFSC